MSDTVIEPTPAIRTAAALLDEAVGHLVRAIGSCGPIGRYEADVECFNLLRLIIRHVETVAVLASRDLVLLPSAVVVARAAYESTIKLLWLAAPDDPFEREVRWLAHLQTDEDYHRKIASRLAKFGKGEADDNVAETIRQFRIAVAAKLPPGLTPLTQLPNLYQMLESMGEERKYLMYILGCQFTHATHHATGIYRKNLGTEKVLGEHVTPRDWAACLSMTWYSLHAAGERFLVRAGGNPRDFLPIDVGSRVQAAIDAVIDA
jgi:hypothetical protein